MKADHVMSLSLFKANLFSNFLVIIIRDEIHFRKKIFMHKKYMFLGSPALIRRAWRTKYICSTAPSWSTIIYKPEKEILVKNVKMPKYPQKSHV
jgi:hypothetical protein